MTDEQGGFSRITLEEVEGMNKDGMYDCLYPDG